MSAKTAPAPAKAADPVMFSLLHAARKLEDRLETSLGEVGLSWPKLSVLTQLVNARESMTLSDLAAGLACVRSNMTQLVDRLEAEGLVRRIADATDRRIVRAELTAMGRDRQAAGAERVDALQSDFAGAMSAADRDVLGRLLGTVK
ncbi:MAG TPA: MarR family transcriptional regulator [Gemmatimonadales bacterium]|jgi:DNA-binding MarR family transcriptional regulator